MGKRHNTTHYLVKRHICFQLRLEKKRKFSVYNDIKNKLTSDEYITVKLLAEATYDCKSDALV